MADTGAIRENMAVISSDGELVGHVSAVRGGGLELRPAAGSGGLSRPLALDRVSRVDHQVHLLDSAAVVRGELGGPAEPPPHRTEGRLKGPFVIGALFLVIALVLLVWGLLYASTDTEPAAPAPVVVPGT